MSNKALFLASLLGILVGLPACRSSPTGPEPQVVVPPPPASTSTLTVSAVQNVTTGTSAGVRVNLDSSRSYTLTASGSASLGGTGFTISKLFYQAAVSTSSGNKNAYFGELSAGTSVTLAGSTYVHFFFIDEATPGSNDNSGSMTVTVADLSSGTSQNVTVSAVQNVVTGTSAGVRVNLDSAKSYTFSASGSASLGGFGFTISKLFYQAAVSSSSGNKNAYFGSVIDGASISISSSAYIHFFFIDEATPGSNDNSGTMTVRYTP